VRSAGGWCSGLADRTEVRSTGCNTSVLACLIFAALVWTAVSNKTSQEQVLHNAAIDTRAHSGGAQALLCWYSCRFTSGRCGGAARRDHLQHLAVIDGALVPDAARLLFQTPAWRNVLKMALMFNLITAW